MFGFGLSTDLGRGSFDYSAYICNQKQRLPRFLVSPIGYSLLPLVLAMSDIIAISLGGPREFL